MAIDFANQEVTSNFNEHRFRSQVKVNSSLEDALKLVEQGGEWVIDTTKTRKTLREGRCCTEIRSVKLNRNACIAFCVGSLCTKFG